MANAFSGWCPVTGDVMVCTVGLDLATEDCLVLTVGILEREVGGRLAAIVGVVDSGGETLILAECFRQPRSAIRDCDQPRPTKYNAS